MPVSPSVAFAGCSLIRFPTKPHACVSEYFPSKEMYAEPSPCGKSVPLWLMRLDGNRGHGMRPAQLSTLRFIALLFILPGLAGLIVSALISTRYLEVMPREPVMTEGRIVPREIHGIVVYQTGGEDRKLNQIEYSSVGVFVVGLLLGLVYLEKWGATQPRYGEEEELADDRT
jgi:hypothetical protein